MATLAELNTEQLKARQKSLRGRLGEVSTLADMSSAGLTLRREELNNRLTELGQPQEIVRPFRNPIENAQFDNDVSSMMSSVEFAGADPKDVMDNYETIKTTEDKIGFAETIRNKRKWELLPFVGSVYKATGVVSLFNDVEAINKGTVQTVEVNPSGFGVISGVGILPIRPTRREASKEEVLAANKRIESFIIKLEERQRRGVSIGGRIAEGIMELPAFMVEFLLTGPLFKTGSTAAKTAGLKVLGRYAQTKAGSLALKVTGAAIGTLVRTGVNIPRVLAGAGENMTQGITITDDGAIAFADAANNPFSALARSFADLYIENLTEIAGPTLKKGAVAAGKGIGRAFPVLVEFTEALAEKWIANAPEGAVRTIGGFLKASATKVGYDGILEEMGEEQLGRILRSATGLQEFSEIIPSMEDLLVEAGIFSVPGGVSLASNRIFRDTPLNVEPVTDLGKVTDEEFEGIIAGPFVPEVERKVVDNTVKTNATRIEGRQEEASVPKLGVLDDLLLAVGRAEDVVGRWGSAGKKVQRDLREISARTAKNVGQTRQNTEAILKGLSAKEKSIVAQLTDGAISSAEQPGRLVQRANMLREQLDIVQEEAQKVGLRKGQLTGKAFPQVLNKQGVEFIEDAELNGLGSPSVFAWAQNQVSEGKFESVDQAVIAIQNFRNSRLRGKEGYLEGTRTFEAGLDMRDWNPTKILPGVIEGSWEQIEAARQWGVTSERSGKTIPFSKIATRIENIRENIGHDEANALEDYIRAQFGLSRANSKVVKWTKRARIIQFAEKLAFSGLTITRNILDRFQKGLALGTIGTNIKATIQFPPIINKFMKKSQQIQDEMIRQGAVLGHGHLSETFEIGEGVTQLIGKPFAASEKGNQTYIALVKKIQLEADVRRLQEMDDETVSKVWDRLTSIVGQSQSQVKERVLTSLTNQQLADVLSEDGQVPDDVMAEVLHRTVTDTAFPLTLASKRMWWGNKPVVQMMTQFKVWSADQMRFIYKDVFKYGVKTGDWSRLGRFIVGTWIAGELYNIARDILQNKDESLLFTLTDEDDRTGGEIAKSIGNALIDGGLIGMLADLTYGITDWAFGPTVASLKNIAVGGVEALLDPASALTATKKFLLKDVPALKQVKGVLDRIDRTFFDDDNLTENYAKWRQRSFDFKRKDTRKQVGIIKETIARGLLGARERFPGPRTLSLEMISRQVLVGDTEDAAKFIVGIFENTPPEKLKDLRAAFRQSAINNSPFGNIAKKDIPRFLAQFSEEGREEGIATQRGWAKNYTEAFSMAVKQLKEDDFLKELKEKLGEN